eukprot:TRINITY_DN9866_c1_g2_i1.p1 TRINITY_DN9866_c1_g2~~TRINITY_DN9866_c1_g2_i1.p1  ORF type:complete len:993 (+),score=155.70 TRINITY_DN9866_c1_g2_i1:39-3017(+)
MRMATDDELLQLLAALSSADNSTRISAEGILDTGRTQQGFPSKLAAFAAQGPATAEAFPLRQLALTILKRLVVEKWRDVNEQDQAMVKQTLLSSLAEEKHNLRGLVHACVVEVRTCGEWPQLHEHLSVSLTQGAPRDAECCAECVAVLLNDCGPAVARALGPLQEPMLRIASSDASPPGLRRQCMSAFVAGAHALLLDKEIDAASIVAQGLPAWLVVATALCNGVTDWSDRERVACAFTAIRAATSLSRIRVLESALIGHIENVLRAGCLLVQGLETAHEGSVVNADDGGISEEDGGVAPLVAQLMELVQAMLERPKLRTLIKGHSKSLLQLLVPFMRVTEAQASTWRSDPNAFIAHEEDDYASGCQVRFSGEGLLAAFISSLKREASKAVAVVVGALLERGEQSRTSGDPFAWKQSELALLLFANVATQVSTKALQIGELAQLVPTMLGAAARLCGDRSAPEFLRARAFVTLRKLGDGVCALSPNDVPGILRASAHGVAPFEPLTVRVCALRTFCRFLTASDDASLKESLLLEQGVLASIGGILRDACEELLHLSLESLTLVIKQCPGAMVSVEASLGQLIVEIWRRCRDPMLHLQVLDAVSCATGSDPRLQVSMETHLLPIVKASLALEADKHATSAAIELLEVLLKRAAFPLQPNIWECVEPLLAAVLRSHESMLMQNACDVLSSLVAKAPSQLAEGGLLVPLLRCVERFLGPDLDDDACVFAGPFVMQVFAKLGSSLSAELRTGLLRAIILRLALATRPFLKQELLVVLARLLHEDLLGMLAAVSAFQVPVHETGGTRCGLEAWLGIWLDSVHEIVSRRALNVTVSALCRLHARCSEDAQLASLRLPGSSADNSLSTRLLSSIISALENENGKSKRLREGTKSGKSDPFSEDEEDADLDDDDDDDEKPGKGGFEKYLFELVDEDDEDDIDGEGSAEDTSGQDADPFANLDLRKTASDYLAANAAAAAGVPPLAERLAAALAEAHAHAM